MLLRKIAFGLFFSMTLIALGCGSNSSADQQAQTPSDLSTGVASSVSEESTNETESQNSDETSGSSQEADSAADLKNRIASFGGGIRAPDSEVSPDETNALALLNADVAKSDADIWSDVMTADKPNWPKPNYQIKWHDDLQYAMQLAESQKRPLLVTFRCLPCKQCSEFDADVLNGGSSLDPLLKQFITVRLTSAELIDLRIFPVKGFQDFDLSWWGWFLSDKAELYGIFGGKDHVSDKTRISEKALVNAMTRVLDHHYNPDRKSWDIDRSAPDLSGSAKLPTELAEYKMWDERTSRPAKERKCLHCHQLGDVMWEKAIHDGTFDKERDIQIWPLPEQVGIQLDRDHGLKVTKIEAGSPTAKAGIKQGDILKVAENQLLFGQADFRGVLHRGPKKDGKIHVRWLRNGTPMEGTLELTDGWRKLPLMQMAWRATISGGHIGPTLGFFPLKTQPSERKRLGLPADKLAVKAYTWNNTAPVMKAGLKRNDIVVAVNGESPDVFGREFITWFKFKFEPGDEVEFEVVGSNKKRRKVKFKASKTVR